MLAQVTSRADRTWWKAHRPGPSGASELDSHGVDLEEFLEVDVVEIFLGDVWPKIGGPVHPTHVSGERATFGTVRLDVVVADSTSTSPTRGTRGSMTFPIQSVALVCALKDRPGVLDRPPLVEQRAKVTRISRACLAAQGRRGRRELPRAGPSVASRNA